MLGNSPGGVGCARWGGGAGSRHRHLKCGPSHDVLAPAAHEQRAARARGGARRGAARVARLLVGACCPRLVPPPRTKWTRRVPHPVLIGHAASLDYSSVRAARALSPARESSMAVAGSMLLAPALDSMHQTWTDIGPGPVREGRGQLLLASPRARAGGERGGRGGPRNSGTVTPPPLVLSGHAASLTPY